MSADPLTVSVVDEQLEIGFFLWYLRQIFYNHIKTFWNLWSFDIHDLISNK